MTRSARTLIPLLALALGAMPLRAQTTAASIDEVAKYFAQGLKPDRILSVLAIECIDFPVDVRAEQRLVSLGADPLFISSLKTVCYRGSYLDVATEPAGAVVLVGNDSMGVTPASFPIAPSVRPVRVTVMRKGVSRYAATTLPAGFRVAVRVELPRDTLQIPAARSYEQIAAALGLTTRLGAPPAEPVAPVPPHTGGGVGKFLLGAFLMGGASAGAGVVLCNPSQTAATAGYLGGPDGRYVKAGEQYKAGIKPTCMAAAAGGGALFGGVMASVIHGVHASGKRHAYQAAALKYPQEKAVWERAMKAREELVARDTGAAAAHEADLRRIAQIRDQNDAILARNAALPPPTIKRTAVDSMMVVADAPAVAPAGNAAAQGAAPVPSGDSLPSFTDEVDLNVPKTGLVNEHGIAVVIGNRKYAKRDVPTVDYAVNDAMAIRKYLVERFGFNPDNIIFETDANLSTFQRIFGRKGEEKGLLYSYLAPNRQSDVFIFYSGHGAPDPNTGKAYLVPADADPNLLSLTGYSMDVLYENLAKLPVRTLTVAIDACFSGGSDRGMLFKGMSPALLRVDNPVLATPYSAVFAASANTEVSGWFEEKHHGLFTYFLLKGLQGEADTPAPDGMTDSLITVRELGLYLTTNVTRLSRRLKQREQNPQIMTADADRVLLPLSRSAQVRMDSIRLASDSAAAAAAAAAAADSAARAGAPGDSTAGARGPGVAPGTAPKPAPPGGTPAAPPPQTPAKPRPSSPLA